MQKCWPNLKFILITLLVSLFSACATTQIRKYHNTFPTSRLFPLSCGQLSILVSKVAPKNHIRPGAFWNIGLSHDYFFILSDRKFAHEALFKWQVHFNASPKNGHCELAIDETERINLTHSAYDEPVWVEVSGNHSRVYLFLNKLEEALNSKTYSSLSSNNSKNNF